MGDDRLSRAMTYAASLALGALLWELAAVHMGPAFLPRFTTTLSRHLRAHHFRRARRRAAKLDGFVLHRTSPSPL